MSTIGFDFGGTKMLAVVVDGDRTVVETRRPAPAGPDEFVALTADVVDQLTSEVGGVTAVGVGAAGLVDAEGAVRFAPNMAGFVEVPLRARLRAAIDLPLVVENDATAAAWGEVALGAARGARQAVMVTLGTGIGGGIVIDGAVYRGAHGYAGEIGHFTVETSEQACACGAVGHWEAIASGAALGRLARERAERGEAEEIARRAGSRAAITGVDVSDAARAGDPDALALLDEFGANVAVGLAALANVLDPECIVVGGGLVALGDLLLEPVRRAFFDRIEAAAHREPIAIVAAQLGERAGAIGAALLAGAAGRDGRAS